MRAFGWAAALILSAAIFAGFLSVLTGWDSDAVHSATLAAVVCGLCEKVWGE